MSLPDYLVLAFVLAVLLVWVAKAVGLLELQSPEQRAHRPKHRAGDPPPDEPKQLWLEDEPTSEVTERIVAAVREEATKGKR